MAEDQWDIYYVVAPKKVSHLFKGLSLVPVRSTFGPLNFLIVL